MAEMNKPKKFQQHRLPFTTWLDLDRFMDKSRNNDSGIDCSPQSVEFLDKQKESLPSCSGRSFTIKSIQSSDSEKFQILSDFRKRGDVDHMFTNPVKCELCDFNALTLFQYYHHIIEHCKRTDDSDFDTDLMQIEMENTDSLYDDDCLTEMSSKKGKRRKTLKPKRCKFRNCNFVTIEKLDIMEAKKKLWQHMRENHKYPLVCPLCPFVTEPKHHMVYHWLGDHTNIRPFKCEEPDCSYTCVAKSMLNSHVVRHWNYYQFNCEECSFKARLLHAMKKHMREKQHSRVMILNEDGTRNHKIIDIYSNKRGPRRKIPIKFQDKPDQIDLNQSSSPAPFPECPELVSHSEPQPQQQSQTVETDSNIKNNKDENLVYSFLYKLSEVISRAIALWKNSDEKENIITWYFLNNTLCNLYKKDVSVYYTGAHMNHFNSLYVMKAIVDEDIKNLSKIYNMAHDNSETSRNNETGASNENANNINTINGSSIYESEYQLKTQYIPTKDNINFEIANSEVDPAETSRNNEADASNENANNINTINGSSIYESEYQLKTQYIPTKDNINFEITNSEVDPADDKKDVDQILTSKERKIEFERLDDTMAATSKNFYLTNNKADACDTISNEIPTFKEESQPQNIILNKPMNIFKLTGATKRKCKTQTRLKVETNTEWNKTESFESLKDIQCILPRESKFNLITDNENLYYCKHCNMKFADQLIHAMHMHFHKIDDPFTCNACGEKCANGVTFNEHFISAKH